MSQNHRNYAHKTCVLVSENGSEFRWIKVSEFIRQNSTFNADNKDPLFANDAEVNVFLLSLKCQEAAYYPGFKIFVSALARARAEEREHQQRSEATEALDVPF
ncbi:hypothetical protein P245_21035 [Comamonas thiooxydans]|uniref:Uncharacterized protein n=1 Tax=Comamonas thiooxydans TaxID=363952 RepID=A0A0E3BXU3_9BURK|nr:hypothetical protein [Comamonas thiooxydans]KGG86206.1 hypothetical protein P245_21035 [Comamonas thiooxydans]